MNTLSSRPDHAGAAHAPESLRAAALETLDVVEAARRPQRAVQAVVDLRAQRPSPLPAPDWADIARCL